MKLNNFNQLKFVLLLFSLAEEDFFPVFFQYLNAIVITRLKNTVTK